MTDASAQSNDPPMLWNGWGDPAAAKPLSPGIRSLLEQALGIEPTDVAAPSLEQVRLRPSALSPSDREGIAAILGAEHVAVADHDRLLRAGGKSTLDLLRRRDFGVQDAPDAVLLPDEPYVFTADDGPECFRTPVELVSGRALTWYGPSLVDAARDVGRDVGRVAPPPTPSGG